MEDIYKDPYDLEDNDVFDPEPELGQRVVSASADADVQRELALKIMRQIGESIQSVITLLEGSGKGTAEAARQLTKLVTARQETYGAQGAREDRVVVQGVFDGRNMLGPDGRLYTVPPNYASKSRLVEGDVLKLAIQSDGSFVFKQIKPVERKRCKGVLAYDEDASCHVVLCGEERFKVLEASVSYYKGEPGDDVIVFVPTAGRSGWAAVENIIKKI